MIKKQLKFSALAVMTLGTGSLLMALFTARASAPTMTGMARLEASTRSHPIATSPANQLTANVLHSAIAPLSAVVNTKTPTGNPGLLDQRHRYALGMIETGNHDGEIGGAGEVSRYQIMPSVWRHYSQSQNYHDPEVSLEVAQQHWTALYNEFKARTHREPTDFDMYVLWNTHHGFYAGKNFDPANLGPIVRGRAQRYVNLVEDGQNGA